MSKSELPAKPGIYTLIVSVAHPAKVEVGGLGWRDFAQGLYAYTGSAIGRSVSLRSRVGRHLESDKKRRWHIDYLLSSEVAAVRTVVYIETSRRVECQVAEGIEGLAEAKILIRGFGSSDCRFRCASHLHYFPSLGLEEAISRVLDVYKRVFAGSTPTTFHVDRFQ